jgi:hypothetical protein|tara:strand:+ start:2134 stop:2664 length:531 start_codon:yes stop_codon:yes gene_type:complete
MAAVKYKVIKNFFTKEELSILSKYCYNKLNQNNDYILDSTSSPSWYKDALMTAILEDKLPVVEKESGLKLFPTYAYWRYYIFGATLYEHTDRPSCEISITACIKKYDNWPLTIEKETIELEEGDALLYAGCDHKHGRPGTYKGEGMAQVFLHYVNQNGPNKDHAYDKQVKLFGGNK